MKNNNIYLKNNKTLPCIIVIGLILIFLLSFFFKLIPQPIELSNHEKIFPLGWDAYLFMNYAKYITETGNIITDYMNTSVIIENYIQYEKMPLFSVFLATYSLTTNIKLLTIFTYAGPLISSFGIFLYYIVLKSLFKKKYLVLLGTAFTAIYNYGFYRGSISVPDNSYFIFFPLVCYFLLLYLKNNQQKYLYLSSAIIGIALLWHASFILLPIYIFVVILLNYKTNKTKKTVFSTFISFLSIFGISFYNNHIIDVKELLKKLFNNLTDASYISNTTINSNNEFIHYKVPDMFEWNNNVNSIFIYLMILGIIVLIYKLFKKQLLQKSEFVFLLIYFCITFIVLQILPIFKVVDTYSRGFLWISLGVVVLVIFSFKTFSKKINPLILIFIVSTIFFVNINYTGRIFDQNLSELEYDGMIWLKNNTAENSIILSQFAHNRMIPAISNRKMLSDSEQDKTKDFFYFNNASQSLNFLNNLIAENNLNNSPIYIYISEKKLKRQLDTSSWKSRSYWDMNKTILDDKSKFQIIYTNEEVTIYKISDELIFES